MKAWVLASGAIAGLMFALWLLSVRKRDASIVDAFWGPGFSVIAWIHLGVADATSPRAWLVAVLVTVWALRLGLHIGVRSLGHDEDYRYAAMRRSWGPRFRWVSLFTVFGLQGVLQLVIGAPLYVAATRPPSPWNALDAVGVLLFVVGLGFEAIGDAQLGRFKKDPAHRGTTLQTGLWRYTRHPNYFGDALLWWGLYVLADLSTGPGFTLFAPLIMTGLLMRVSGVPLLEARMKKTRPDFADYARRTSSFFPWLPKKPESR